MILVCLYDSFQDSKKEGDERLDKAPFKNPPELLPRCALVRSSHLKCSVRKGVLKNYAKFAGKTSVPESLF